MLIQPTLPKPTLAIDRIALAGPMASGKTTIANALVERFNYKKQSFARVLKDTAETLYGPIEKNNEGRKLLQEFADDLKKWDPNLFTTHLLLDIEEDIEDGLEFHVIDDLRFKFEYDALKRNGFTIIGVRCNDNVRMQRIRSLYPDTDPSRFEHPSETGWKDMIMDYWIDTTSPFSQDKLYEIFANVAL